MFDPNFLKKPKGITGAELEYVWLKCEDEDTGADKIFCPQYLQTKVAFVKRVFS
jgi:hypothetical protein